MVMIPSVGTIRPYIKADATRVEVILDRVVAKLKADVNSSALEVDESRFPAGRARNRL